MKPAKDLLVARLLKLRLKLMSRAAANARIRRETDRSLAQLEGLSEELLARPIPVPPMLGVDEDMQNWSFYQILEHDTLVNHAFTRIITSLVENRSLTNLPHPKTGVLPSARPGPDSVAAFKDSVQTHLDEVSRLGKLRGTPTHPHPVCQQLDAHGWHAFFGIHLYLHRRQMEVMRQSLQE